MTHVDMRLSPWRKEKSQRSQRSFPSKNHLTRKKNASVFLWLHVISHDASVEVAISNVSAEVCLGRQQMRCADFAF